MTYRFDPELREQVTEQLYGLLPELYRLRDLGDVKQPLKAQQTTPGLEELYRFLHVLAAPLSTLRQNIEELHANLFVDTAADWVLPYLARLIELKLIFPEANANRRDLRSAVTFRRRKGTLSALEALGNELSGKLVVSSEGFQRCFVSQDLDWLRPKHNLPNVTQALLAENATGALDRQYHIVDIRPPTRHTGRYHPRQIAHWLHATQLFPLREGRPGVGASGNGAPADDRFTFDPLSRVVELRARRLSQDSQLASDRIRAEHFRLQPEQYFEVSEPAQICVRVNGLPAAVAREGASERLASRLPAHPVLTASGVTLLRLVRDASRRSNDTEIAVVAVPLSGLAPSSAGSIVRGSLTINENGTESSGALNSAVLPDPYVAMLRLRRSDAQRGFFAGATLTLSSQHLEARRASADGELAIEGFARGAVHVEIPPLWLSRNAANTPDSGRWLYIAADGSLYEAQTQAARETGAFADVPLTAGMTLPPVLIQSGPPPAFPALATRQTPRPLLPAPLSPQRSPVVLHGGRVLRRSGPNILALGVAPTMALTFALVRSGVFEPFMRLRFGSDDPTSSVTFEALAPSGIATTLTSARSAAAEVFTRIDPVSGAIVFRDLGEHQLVVRFESGNSGIILPPCELSLSLATGRTLLVHLPELETQLTVPAWSNSLPFCSVVVRVHDDGSTAYFGNGELARASHGDVTPLSGSSVLLRRRLRQRVLCGWSKEGVAPPHVPPTPASFLDIDVEHGLFALATSDQRVPYPTIAGQTSLPAVVTVDAQEGYSHHVGSRPAFREPVLAKTLAKPTRLVVGHGKFNRRLRPELLHLPQHASLSEALGAIDVMPAHAFEVVQIEDSNTYVESWMWPSTIARLTIQAAEGERPVLRLTGNVIASAAAFERINLIGIGISGGNVGFPSCRELKLHGVSVFERERVFSLSAGAEPLLLDVTHSLMSRFTINGEAQLHFGDSVLDAQGGLALSARDATATFERCTVAASGGPTLPGGEPLCVRVQVLSASDSLFVAAVQALDRFHGCIRYSRVATGSETPRRHRVTEDEPAFVSLDRSNAAHLRLSERCSGSIRLGAEDGGELGAFHGARLEQMTHAIGQRLREFTPAGLRAGLIRVD